MRTLHSIITVVVITACGGKATKKQSTPPAKHATTAQSTPAATAAKSVAASPNVSVSADLARQCNLRFANVEQAPKFGFDDSELLPADRNLLEQVAQCLIRGPLQGRIVQLVGRADPRGTDEYNLGLGTRRAESVRLYLERLGVPISHLSPTTRGELDAIGTDAISWQRDRRVDLQLVN